MISVGGWGCVYMLLLQIAFLITEMFGLVHYENKDGELIQLAQTPTPMKTHHTCMQKHMQVH